MKNAAIRRSNQLLGISISWKVPKNLISWIRSHEKMNFDLMKFDLMTQSLSNYFILLQNQKASFNSRFLIFSFKTEFYHFFLKLHYSFQTSPTASPNSSATTGSSSSSGKKRSSANSRITAPSPQLLALESFRISGHFGKQFRREI